ncbi:IctB family putative bicarbonate transporter [Leptolyngbya sp. CCNP1308]|uniref:IctB family putative bicarbonate transporter n=1 Tax=Leptolyngbya sp. CCNP1308 TaxID=3110255 RepID=UPI002B2213C1|nr:IctB family putative bicarbonate transporter [Leptolyngbya sp. CCNP1308]MEA5447217.1 IctB family putative bicarbonate transporter [Leptolyngbya sp. CCNP1308]
MGRILLAIAPSAMLTDFWQQLTLTGFALEQWRDASLIHRLLAPLRRWRQGSRLLPWGDWIGLAIVVVLFALAPYVSTTLIGVLLLAAAALWALLTLTDEAGVGLSPVHLTVAVYWGVMVLATAFSPVRGAAVSGLIKLTLNILLFLLIARVARRPRARGLLILAYILTTLPVAVYGLRQYFFGATALATWVDSNSAVADVTRVYSFLGNPNLLAGYLIPGVMLSAAAVFAWPRWVPKGLALLATLINTLCLILTLSRGGWIGFLIAGFVLMTLLVQYWSIWFSPFWQRWALPLLLGGAAAVVIAGVIAVDSLRARVLSIFVGRADSSNNFRMNVWAAVIDMIRARPILGIGPGNDAFNAVYPLFQRPRYTALSAYSVFLEVLVEGGIIGLTAFLWLLLLIFHQGWVQLQRLRETQDQQGYWLMGAIASISGILGQGIADTVMYRPQISTLWWMAIALVASYYPAQGWSGRSFKVRQE